VDINVQFTDSFAVAGTNPLPVSLEFDLRHPATIVPHVTNTGTVYAVSFKSGEVREHRLASITDLVLRHAYATLTGVASGNGSITVTKVVPTIPVVTPESAQATTTTLTFNVDGTNGTIVDDLDSKTETVVKDFSTLAKYVTATGTPPVSPPTEYLRIAARYQPDGSLVATRILASTQFSTVWEGPEGHVLHVRPYNNTIVVSSDTGPQVLQVTDATTFSFQGTQIGTGTAFLATASDLRRGFKVITTVDSSTTPATARSVDIQTARFEGWIANVDNPTTLDANSGFNYRRSFFTNSDNYGVHLPYIAPSTPNGTVGAPTSGFVFWEFAFPTQLDANLADFQTISAGVVNLGFLGTLGAYGTTNALWGDGTASNPTGWHAPWSILLPTPLPRGIVSSALSASPPQGSTVVLPTGVEAFQVNFFQATVPTTIDVNTNAGSATLVYEISRVNDVVTVKALDVTNATDLATLTTDLKVGATVKAYGVPKLDGTIGAYVLNVFTGEQPED
jgi:hypothetical protein